MKIFMCFIVAVIIGSMLWLILEYFFPRKSPDTFPDDKFLATWKRYSTMEIAKALDKISEGI